MAVELATAYVSITASAKGIQRSIEQEFGAPLEKATRKAGDTASNEISRVQRASAGLGKVLGAGFAGFAVGGAVVDGISRAVGAAVDFQETVSKTEAIFGDQSDAIREWADQAAADFGQSKQGALDAASTFGNIFDQLGFGTDQTAAFSQQLTELASDFASFHNADITQVIEAQTAAFRGEFDALQRFVPTITAASVQQQAMAETGKTNAAALTAQEKAAATVTLMFRDAGEALGDFDRTADSAANRSRTLQATLDNLTVTIGQKLLPIVDEGIRSLGGLASVASAAEQKDAGGFFDGLKDAAGGFLGTLQEFRQINPLTVGIDALITNAEDAGRSLLGMGSGAQEAADGLGAVTEGASRSAGAIRAQRAALDAAADSSGALAGAAQSVADQLAGIEEKANDALTATLSLFDSQIGLESALQGVDEAAVGVLSNMDAIAAGGEGAAEASGNLSESQRDFRASALEAAASAARLAEDQARLEGRTLSASEKAQAQVGALEDLAGKFPTLRPLIQGYIDKLNEVPPSKATDVSVNDRASAVLANILRQLARISGQRYVADVSAGGAEPHAKGGPVAAGMPYLVGEEGPELFVPKRSGTIVPNRSGAMSGISAIGPASATVYDLRGAVIASDTELARRMRRAGQVGTLVGIG